MVTKGLNANYHEWARIIHEWLYSNYMSLTTNLTNLHEWYFKSQSLIVVQTEGLNLLNCVHEAALDFVEDDYTEEEEDTHKGETIA